MIPGQRMRQLEAEARLKSGPMTGAGDACRHPDSKYFDRLLMWPLENKRNFDRQRARSTPEAVEHRKKLAEDHKISLITAAADAKDPIEAAHAAEVARSAAPLPSTSPALGTETRREREKARERERESLRSDPFPLQTPCRARRAAPALWKFAA